MPKINIKQTTNLSPDEAFGRIKEAIPNDSDLKQLDGNYQCQFDDARRSGTAKGNKFKADMTVTDSSPTEVTVVVDLPLMLSPFKGMVEKTLSKKFDKLLS